MQKSVNSVAPAGKSRLVYLEYLRAAATIAVVFLHVVAALNTNQSPQELGVANYSFFSACHMLVTWAVPCFVMISGSLLLAPERNMDVAKIGKYVGRMAAILLTFGVAYAGMELVFTRRSFSLPVVLEAVLNMLQGKSWSHIWYVYMLISLYLVTIPLRCFVEKVDNRTLGLFICLLVAGNVVIPSINAVFGTEIENYMVLNQYVCYYLLGYYLSRMKKEIPGTIVIAIVTTVLMGCLECISILRTNADFAMNHFVGGGLVFIQSCSVFLYFKQLGTKHNLKSGRVLKVICSTSFGVYLVHPLFGNIFYKVLGITPLSMPILVGVVVLTLGIYLLSLLLTMLIKKIPVVKMWL